MTPHPTNTRALLRPIAEKFAAQEPLFGIEQEYTFFKKSHPLGFPAGGFPAPQGFYYCGVGADEVYGRDIVEAHLEACLEAGLGLSGINAEVMPGQWEFQVGPLGPLEVSDRGGNIAGLIQVVGSVPRWRDRGLLLQFLDPRVRDPPLLVELATEGAPSHILRPHAVRLRPQIYGPSRVCSNARKARIGKARGRYRGSDHP
jgi:hypothetical protein